MNSSISIDGCQGHIAVQTFIQKSGFSIISTWRNVDPNLLFMRRLDLCACFCLYCFPKAEEGKTAAEFKQIIGSHVGEEVAETRRAVSARCNGREVVSSLLGAC